MISIIKATEKDYKAIADIGKISVTEAHKESCSPDIMNAYIEKNYNNDSIRKELLDQSNIYHIINYNQQPAGFSKINFNAAHDNITKENITKLDRIYLLPEFHGLKLGLHLLNFNIELARNSDQSGIWLYTWTENKKAIDFYTKAGFNIIGGHDFAVAQGHYNPNYHMFLEL